MDIFKNLAVLAVSFALVAAAPAARAHQTNGVRPSPSSGPIGVQAPVPRPPRPAVVAPAYPVAPSAPVRSSPPVAVLPAPNPHIGIHRDSHRLYSSQPFQIFSNGTFDYGFDSFGYRKGDCDYLRRKSIRTGWARWQQLYQECVRH